MVKHLMSLMLIYSFAAYASDTGKSDEFLSDLLAANAGAVENQQSKPLDKADRRSQIKSSNLNLRTASPSSVKKRSKSANINPRVKPRQSATPLHELFNQIVDENSPFDWANNGCPHIKPSSFSPLGKEILENYIKVWVTAADNYNISTNRGLAQIYDGMDRDGVEKLINDLPALQKANEYHTEYKKSPSVKVEDHQKKMRYGSKDDYSVDGDYYFPGVKNAAKDLVHITRLHALLNIMYKRHEAEDMPVNNLIFTLLDQGFGSAKEVLELNRDNTKLVPAAIRGKVLLLAYYRQQDEQS